MTEYYEVHITALTNKAHDRESLRALTTRSGAGGHLAPGWKFSAIDGDPVLGDGVKCYFTKQFKKSDNMQDRDIIETVMVVGGYLKSWGVDVIREKVELVIYDTKSSKVKPY